MLKQLKIPAIQWIAVILSSTLTACGGSSQPQTDSNLNADRSQPYGDIRIVNQGDKLTVDAWFLNVAFTEQIDPTSSPGLFGEALFTSDDDRCVELQTHYRITDPSSLELLDNTQASKPTSMGSQVGEYWQSAYSVGNQITIDTRTGTYANLMPQELNGSVSYATEARWIRDPFPDDATLSIPGSEHFPAVEAVALNAVSQMESVLPSEKVVNVEQPQISWEPQPSPHTRIQVNFTASDQLMNREVEQISCSLLDDGSFEVPIVVFNTFAGSPAINFSIRREVFQTLEIDGAILNITQQDWAL
ncbi:MAG: hypothetical protein KTR35_03400 [Gammaproteobacteria bacterium]|nr:hypothetical protein [Gammaproteobacteria bacterium]